MKKFLSTAAFILSVVIVSPSFAASWTNAVNAAISGGKFDQIDVIAAKNPSDAGAIAAYVLQQAQNSTSNPDKAVKLLNAATPLAGQIAEADMPGAMNALNAVLKLANDPGFQKSHTHAAGEIFADALNISDQPNFGKQDPHLHDTILSQATDFMNNNPGLDDDKLKDDLLLAQGNDFLHNNPDTDVIRRNFPFKPNDNTPPNPPSPE